MTLMRDTTQSPRFTGLIICIFTIELKSLRICVDVWLPLNDLDLEVCKSVTGQLNVEEVITYIWVFANQIHS